MSSGGRIIVFAAPAGGGKSTIIRRLRASHPEWGFSVSATTRAPRPGEMDGREYHYLSREEFERRVQGGEFLEYEEVHGDRYGTLRQPTETRLAQGETLIFDVDVKGALSIKAAFPQALTIFLLPPSREVLVSRLVGRGTESAEAVERRIARAEMEIALAHRFDAQCINDHLDGAVAAVERAIAQWTVVAK